MPLRNFADHVLPWLYATFGAAFVTGLALFFYDPIGVGIAEPVSLATWTLVMACASLNVEGVPKVLLR